jgi:hypothetical protein
VGLTNLGTESETCVGSRVHLVGVSISFEKNFYWLPFTPPLSGSPYRSFKTSEPDFESGWKGVRASYGIPLAPVLGADHHRDGLWRLIFSARSPT